ncbi:hypothetical protein ACQP1O_25030 [Nocardia sp. CA-151230]|uniref:hypothetical protein n=1 Tax=Nocardia sp. CA-151230 TaxID=3239982 RepID=UPI003D8A5910
MPTTADWLSLRQFAQGQDPYALPAELAALGQSLVGIAPAVDTGRGDPAVGPANALADSWTGIEHVDAPDPMPTVDQQPVQTFCAYLPVDPERCSVAVVDAGVGAGIGAGIGAGVSAPVAIGAGLVGAAAGFVVGIPFLPTGLVIGPLLGAAVGVAVVAGPAALLGGALGASIGAIVGLASPLAPPGGPIDGSGAPVTST